MSEAISAKQIKVENKILIWTYYEATCFSANVLTRPASQPEKL